MATGSVEITEGFTTADGRRIRYIEAGEGYPLLLLNGRDALLSGEQWRINMPALSEAAHVYAIDVLGYGKSDLPTSGYTFDTFVEMLRGFMDSLGIERADVGGQSLGGWFAALFAWRYPERVRKLILVGNAGANLQGPPAPTEWTPPEKDYIRERMVWAYGDNLEATDEMIDELYGLARRPGRGEAWLALIEATHDMEQRQKYLLLDKLPDVQAPTLIVWGSNPTGIGLEHAHSQHEALPNSRLAIIEGGSHSAQGIRPREFEREVVAFLREPV